MAEGKDKALIMQIDKLYLAKEEEGVISFTETASIVLLSGFQRLVITDMNGDGMLDIMKLNRLTSSKGEIYQCELYAFNGSKFTYQGALGTITHARRSVL